MLFYDDSKIQDRKLILLARFHPEFLCSELFPEIEQNSIQFHVEKRILDNFRRYKNLENCLYFYIGFAYADIPAGQEYEMIMCINGGKIEPDTVMKCRTTVLCLFSQFKTQPIEFAWKGHHAICQIQFCDGIPDIIQELYEITERKPIKITREICLCSFDTLKANINVSFSE